MEGAGDGVFQIHGEPEIARDGSFRVVIRRLIARRPKYSAGLVARAPGYGGLGPTLPTTDTLDVTSLTLTGVTIEMRRLAGGTLRFVDQTRTPLRKHGVRLWPEGHFLGGGHWLWGPFGIEGSTDENGEVTFKDVWPGRLKGRVLGEVFAGEVAVDIPRTTGPALVTASVVAASYDQYFGTVRDTQGNPLPDVAVQACSRSPGHWRPRLRLAKTDGLGNYVLTGMSEPPEGILFMKPNYGAIGGKPGEAKFVHRVKPGRIDVVLEKSPGRYSLELGSWPMRHHASSGNFYRKHMKLLDEGKQWASEEEVGLSYTK
jgi:hypothetical protein